jgi:hypothetical protein
VPGESPNRGEWIEIDVPRGEVDKLAIFPGFNKTEETWGDYPRVKQMRVDIFALDDDQVAKQVGSTTLDIADKREWQTFDLADAKIDAGLFGGRIRISIIDIHDGEDYPNLGISEILVHMKEFDAKVKVTALNEGDPSGATAMLDEDAKTVAKLPGTSATMTLESSGFGISSINFIAAKDHSRPKTVEITAANHRTIWPISASRSMGRGVYAIQGVLYDATGDRVVEVADLLRARSLPGRHNWQNAAAAYAAARAIGVPAEEAAEGLMTFPGLAHRMETVASIGQVRFINDSKATNADAARQALSSYPRVYWIAGGQPKEGGIAPLADLFGRVAKAYLIGDGEHPARLMHPGDALFVPGEPVEVLATPAAAPWLKISEAVDYLRAVAPRHAVPIHQGIIAAQALPIFYGRLTEMTDTDFRVLTEERSQRF